MQDTLWDIYIYPQVKSQKRLLWKAACNDDIYGYQRCLDMELDHLNIPAEAAVCNDPDSCCHHIDIQRYCDGLVGAMLKAAKVCIPRGKGKNGRRIGFDRVLKELKRSARADYRRWRIAGKPRHGQLYKAMSQGSVLSSS